MPMNIYTFNNNRNSSEDHIKTLKDIASEHHYNIHIFKYTNKDELVFDLSSHPERADIIFLRISKSKDDEITGLEAAKVSASFAVMPCSFLSLPINSWLQILS